MKFMFNKSKSLCVILVSVLLCIFISACGAPENLDADYTIGIWKAEYTENGNLVSTSIALSEFGEYGIVTYVGGEFTAAEIGTYKLNGNTVLLYKSGEDEATMLLEYSGGNLTNEGHKYKKQLADE